MGAHCFPGRNGIALLNRREDPLVMELSAFRSAVDIENPATLLAQKADNRIQQRED